MVTLVPSTADDAALPDVALAQGKPWRAACEIARKLIHGSALASSLSAADREDVAQNAAISVFLRWERYDASRGPRIAWMAGIVKIELYRWMRRERRAPVHPVADLPDVPVESETERTAGARELLATLPAGERRVVELYAAGYTLRQVAQREGIAPSTALARHERALRRLGEAT